MSARAACQKARSERHTDDYAVKNDAQSSVDKSSILYRRTELALLLG